MPNPMSQTAIRATSVADHGGHVDASREADHWTIFSCLLSIASKEYACRWAVRAALGEQSPPPNPRCNTPHPRLANKIIARFGPTVQHVSTLLSATRPRR
jgi:hypothetical protein